MKRITIDQFEGFSKMDVYFIDTNNDNGIEEVREGLSHTEACDYINKLIIDHQMSDTDLIRNNWYDSIGHLVDSEKMTIKEYCYISITNEGD